MNYGLDKNIIATLCSAALLTGCPDDPSPGTDESSSGEDSTGATMTSPVTVTQGMTMGSTSNADTSTGADSTTTVSATETGETTVAESSTGEPSTGESSTGEPSTGGAPGADYGDCINGAACSAGAICLDAGIAGACGEQNCADASECAVPVTGTASPACIDVDDDGANDCFLDCSMGEACPDGMACTFDFICMWPLIAPGGGACPDQDLGNAVPQMIMGDNTGLFDDVVQTCAAGGGEDALFQFTAPADALYVFDTAGSGFDTALSLIDGCGGPELVCNDDFGKELTSQVSLSMVTGQSVVVVVDSYDGGTGPLNLNIDSFLPGACPDQDLGSSVPQMVMGNNAGLVDDHAPSCAPGGEDALYLFTAPMAGTYVFDTAGSTFDTVLAVLDGCGGTELDCNDDFGGATSEITIALLDGESVVIVVDGFDGDTGAFNLNVSQL